jgi:uncharacterized protein YecT (DUF1311 family)
LAQVAPGADCTALKTQAEMNQCYEKVHQAAENDLADVYRKLDAKLKEPAKKALLDAAQKTWKDYRERECALETADTQGGSPHPMQLSICLTEKTGARVEELARQLNCPEGDMTCVH